MSFFWAFRYASGFPLYLCSLHFSSLKNISKFPNPRSRIPFLARSQRMPLQSLTQQATSNELRALGKTAHNSQLTARCKFSTFNFPFSISKCFPPQSPQCLLPLLSPISQMSSDIKDKLSLFLPDGSPSGLLWNSS